MGEFFGDAHCVCSEVKRNERSGFLSCVHSGVVKISIYGNLYPRLILVREWQGRKVGKIQNPNGCWWPFCK